MEVDKLKKERDDDKKAKD